MLASSTHRQFWTTTARITTAEKKCTLSNSYSSWQKVVSSRKKPESPTNNC